MSKKLQLVALDLVHCVIDDAAGQLAIATKEVLNYKQRLSLLVETRGLRVLTIDFPESGKFLERSLERGYVSNDFPQILGYHCGAGPRLFLALFQTVFNEDGTLRSDYSVEAVFWLRQIFYAVKKLRMECSDERSFATVSAFCSTDETLPPPTLCWGGDDLVDGGRLSNVASRIHTLDRVVGYRGDYRRNPSGDLWSSLGECEATNPGLSDVGRALECFQAVSDRMAASLGPLDVWSLRGGHGKGAVSDASTKDWKYRFPSWPVKLERAFPADWFATPDLGVSTSSVKWDAPLSGVSPEWELQRRDLLQGWRDLYLSSRAARASSYDALPVQAPLRARLSSDTLDGPSDRGHPAVGSFRLLESTKLITVPKTQKAPRLIASEPTGHQWMQHAIAVWLKDRMAETWFHKAVDITNQGASRQLCVEASKTQKHATVDLSDASDRITCWLVERVFRSNYSLLEALHAVRSRLTRNPIDKKSPSLLGLRKFTSMGSAVTFPVQSVIFTMAAVAAVILSKNQRVSKTTIHKALAQVRVYGDDIIVPVTAYGQLVTLLHSVFLKVNEAKSFVRGPFRESCGMDAVGGFSVTPAYFLQDYEVESPESVLSVVESSNNFWKVGSWRASSYILGRLPLAIRRSLSLEKLESIVPQVPRTERDFRAEVASAGAVTLALDSFTTTRVVGEQRWNEELHRFERRALSLLQRVKRTVPESHQLLLQWFTEGRTDPSWIDTFYPGEFLVGYSKEKPSLRLQKRWVPDISSG